MSYPRGSAILPASMAVFGKMKVDLKTIMEFWKDGSVLVCSRDNGYGSKPTIIFLSSCGKASFNRIGQVFAAYHDQSLKAYGDHTILNVINYSPGPDKPRMQYALTTHLHDKLPVFVYK